MSFVSSITVTIRHASARAPIHSTSSVYYAYQEALLGIEWVSTVMFVTHCGSTKKSKVQGVYH